MLKRVFKVPRVRNRRVRWLYKKNIHEINDMLEKKEVTVAEVTQSVVERINAVENLTDAYLRLTTDQALIDAAAVDEKLETRQKLTPLEGIPYALKDNMCTEGIITTCASKILYNYNPPYNAHVYDLLRRDGCILLGKLNMDEFAMGSSTETSAYKKTKNPWDLTKACGSSGGSAFGASDTAFFSLGSDTGGSIRTSLIVWRGGLKPTYGLVSR